MIYKRVNILSSMYLSVDVLCAFQLFKRFHLSDYALPTVVS